MRKYFTIGLVFLLAACTQKTTPISDEEKAVPVQQSSSLQSSEHSSASAARQSSVNAVIWEEYIDAKLGIAFKYPSYVGDGAHFECNAHPIPLQVFSHNERIILAQEFYLTSDCSSSVKPTNADILSESQPSFPLDKSGGQVEGFYDQRIAGSLLNIWVTRVKNREGLLGFIQQIYGPACRLSEEGEQKISDTETRIFLTTDSTSIEDALSCGDRSIFFNPQTGAVMTFYMPLKTAVSFSTPDHRDSFDSEIAGSFRFLP